jgi:beta-glucosidase/6-phospho-beta-glucosidase/beta-galactosidase
MFQSFFFAGFECATGYNVHGQWIDQIAKTQHDLFAEEDYRRLRETGLRAVREGIRWPCVDTKGRYDFSSILPFVDASWKHGIEVIWDLFHYGYPEDIDLFSDEFPRRFAEYCHAAAEFVRSHQDGPYYFTPVNEPSFLSWAAGDHRRFAPHCVGKASDLKIALARAGIQGINAIRRVIADSRIVNVDPICNVVAPMDRPDLAAAIDQFNHAAVFESLDMLCGRKLPELGGSREHLDITGINYYWTNQWELGKDEQPLADGDPRRISLRDIVRRVWERYGGEVLITETAHVDRMRPGWLNYVTDEVEAMLNEEIPLRGVCLYPILTMPEWHMRDQWTRMGLWDLENRDGILHRKAYKPMLEALQRAQSRNLQACPA